MTDTSSIIASEEHTSNEPPASSFDNQDDERKFHLSTIAKSFFIHSAFTICALILVLLALPYFGDVVERYLFPSSQVIEKIQTDVNHQNSINEQRAKGIDAFKMQTKTDIDALKDEIVTLQTALKGMDEQLKLTQDRLSKSIQSQPITSSGFIADQWGRVESRFNHGEIFESELHALIPLVGAYKTVLESLHPVVPFANQMTKTFVTLVGELEDAKNKFEALVFESDDVSFVSRVWRGMKNIITFESVHAPAVNIDSHEKRTRVITAIEQAINHIKGNRYDQAIRVIRSLDSIVKSYFNTWLNEADKRLSAEKVFDALRQRISPIIHK
jgi:hypothetical protein